TSMLLLLGFALPPVAALRGVAPGRVLRRDPQFDLQMGRGRAYLPGLLAFLLLVLWVSRDLRLTLLLCGGFALATLSFAAVGWVLVGAASRSGRRFTRHATLRFALAGMARRR